MQIILCNQLIIYIYTIIHLLKCKHAYFLGSLTKSTSLHTLFNISEVSTSGTWDFCKPSLHFGLAHIWHGMLFHNCCSNAIISISLNEFNVIHGLLKPLHKPVMIETNNHNKYNKIMHSAQYLKAWNIWIEFLLLLPFRILHHHAFVF